MIGLARLLSLQKYLNYEMDAIMVCFPGLCPTNGTDRLQKGYSLGVVLRYNYSSSNSKKEPLIILDPKINCCGVLVANFTEFFPVQEEVVKRITNLIKKDLRLWGVRINIEKYFIGNHFINFYQKATSKEEKGYWIVIHGSGEIRNDSALGMGIYIDESQKLQKIARRYNTPLGPIYYLLGEEAMVFMDQYRKAEKISAESREYLARKIIPNLRILCNVSHLTIIKPGNYFLGIYSTVPGEIYPFLINEKDGIALMEAQQCFFANTFEILGWKEQIAQLDVEDLLKSINGLPHGCGKIYNQNQYQLIYAFYQRGRILYTISDGKNNFTVDNLKSLGPVTYKGEEELNYIKRLGLLATEVQRLSFGKNGFSLNAKNWKNCF
jgi:hypothetical protein